MHIKKSTKHSFVIFFPVYKNINWITGYYQKTRKNDFEKRLVKGIKIFLKKKSKNMVVNDIEIFLKKKTKRFVSFLNRNIIFFIECTY